MTQRYFVDSLPASGGIVELSTSEAQHAFRVMRLSIGCEIQLFDGNGHEARATVAQINRNECICDAMTSSQISRESVVGLHLAVAIPKGDRAKEMVMRLTELGVAQITPITAARSQRPIRDNATDKLSRVVIEASKQCGRNHLLKLSEPKSLPEFLKSLSDSDEKRWILHTQMELAHGVLDSEAKRIVALIGPEGGWTEDELQMSLEAGFTTVSLGNRILRIETAACAVAAIVCCKMSG